MLIPDIAALVFEYLHDDKASLASCSLVSKTWALPARFHLFRLLIIRRVPSHDGMAEFIEFLSTPWGKSHVPYVRTLVLKGNTDYHNEPQVDATIDLVTLGSMLDKLYNLVEVEIQALGWHGLNPDAPAPPMAPSVRSLTVSQISMWIFDSLEEVMDIFHLFPNVKNVRTNEIPWHNHFEVTEGWQPILSRRPFPPELQIELLILRTSGLTWRFFEISERMTMFHRLTSLCVWYIQVDHIRSLGRFLRNVCGHLRYLQIKLSDIRFIDDHTWPSPAEYWSQLELYKCTNLESFAVFVPLDDNPDCGRPALDYWPYWDSALILLNALPPTVRTLRIGIESILNEEYFLEELLDEVEWDVVDALVDRLPDLEKVTFLWEDRRSEIFLQQLPLWTRKFIKTSLPRMKAKKLLSFESPNKRKGKPPQVTLEQRPLEQRWTHTPSHGMRC